ncbi:MAG: UDP-glucose 4-epimerase [Pseudonocardiales bacterium]|nr:UDP-glucose 4-epimerase [Pseudonocardiales bacterium]
MKILVTGAAGFVGYAVAALLVEHGHEVTGLTRSQASALPTGVQRLQGDLRTPETLPTTLAEVDGVCHLAGLTKVRESRSNPVDHWRTNVGGTLTILDRLAGARAGRIVLASTCAVYGEQAEQPISETATGAPSSPYGTSKLAADQAAADLAATGSIGAISLRAFNVAGALSGHPDRDATRLIPQLLAVQQRRAPELVVNGDGTAVRDFVHVADMATAFVLALHACEPGTWRAYNVGSGRPSTVHDVIAAVETVTGRPVPRRHTAAAHEPATLLADSTRIRSALGWRPHKSSLTEIISDAWTALNSD